MDVLYKLGGLPVGSGPMASTKIDTLIQNFANSLRAAIAEEAAAAFAHVAGAGVISSPVRGKPGPKPKAARANAKAPGVRIRRSADTLDQQAKSILGYVKKNPAQRAEQIGAALGLATSEMALPIAKLLKEKQLQKKGVKRATAYSAK